MDKVGIGLLGYGTVGSGVGTLLTRNADDITLATGKQVYLRRVLERSPDFSAPGLESALASSSVPVAAPSCSTRPRAPTCTCASRRAPSAPCR